MINIKAQGRTIRTSQLGAFLHPDRGCVFAVITRAITATTGTATRRHGIANAWALLNRDPVIPMADLAIFLTNEFLPLQQDGGLWRHKDPTETAIHYLKTMAERIEELEMETRDLGEQVRSLSL